MLTMGAVGPALRSRWTRRVTLLVTVGSIVVAAPLLKRQFSISNVGGVA